MYSTVPWSRVFRKAVSDADVDHPYSGTRRHSGSEATTKKKTALAQRGLCGVRTQQDDGVRSSGRQRVGTSRHTLTQLSPPECLDLHNWHESHHKVHRKQGTHLPSAKVLVKRNTSPAPAASPFRPNRNSVTHDGPSRTWEPNDSARRRRVRSHLIQAALRAPTVGENEACSEALVEQQDWDKTCTSRWPESSRVLMQNGAERNDESGTGLPNAQQSLADTASADSSRSSVDQPEAGHHPAVRSPPPHDSWWKSGHAQLQRNTTHTARVVIQPS